MRMTLGEIAAACGGCLVRGSADRIVSHVGTDSRSIGEGQLFCALDGPKHLGADFVASACAAGACGAIVHDEREFPEAECLILVVDTLRAFGDIARAWRVKVGARVVALSGSSGKTTTKEMLAQIVRGAVPFISTEGNKNNLVGLPMTLLRMEESTRVAVVELGMNHPGELARLTEICDPDIAIITNIGNAHIGNFGGMEELMRGEAEIIGAMRTTATLLLNASCPNHAKLVDKYHFKGRIATFGFGEGVEVHASDVVPTEPMGYRFRISTDEASAEFSISIFGRYNVDNALAATAAALALGLDMPWIAERIGKFATGAMRSELEHFDGIAIVKDCYNASPAAMLRSIQSAAETPLASRRVALVGDMLELGDLARHFHLEVGVALGHAQFDVVCAVGEWTPLVVEEAARLGVRAEHFPDARGAANFLAEELRSGDLLLVKGSRGNRLEVCLGLFKETRVALRNGDLAAIVNAEAGHA